MESFGRARLTRGAHRPPFDKARGGVGASSHASWASISPVATHPSLQFNNKFTSQRGQQQQRNSRLTDTLRLFAPRSSNSSAVDAAPLALRFESIVAPCNRCRVKLAITTHTVSELFEYVAPVNELNCNWRQRGEARKDGVRRDYCGRDDRNWRGFDARTARRKATELQNRPVQDKRMSVHDRCVLTLRLENR